MQATPQLQLHKAKQQHLPKQSNEGSYLARGVAREHTATQLLLSCSVEKRGKGREACKAAASAEKPGRGEI